MCGIAGFLNLDAAPAAANVARAMADMLVHRGPDGEDHYQDGPFAVGHRRLAIMDLSPAGKQPMVSRCGRYVLAYNGEVYNYAELRGELKAKGHLFFSHCDTEVVLNALVEWGEQAIERFNGMFAFALWDRTERRLLLARDRYGIKPLYLYRNGRTVLFASEIKAFVRHPDFQVNVDLEGMLEYFTFQNFFTEKTLFKGAELMPAGTTLTLEPGMNGAEPRRYWDYDFREPEEAPDPGASLEQLDGLFQQAVQRQLVADVEIGTYLSGGLDSGTIAAIASRQIPHLTSFTCGFDLSSASGIELAFDERESAEQMSYLFGTEHYEMVLKAGDMERILPKLVWHLEEPRVGQSYPNLYVARLASKFVTVILSGSGGDELFAGYPWRYYRAVASTDFDNFIDNYYLFWQRLIPNRQVKEVFAPIYDQVEHVWTRDIFRDVFASQVPNLSRPEDYINHSLYLEAKTFLQGLLIVEDKLSMAHSLETRVPFLDNDLVDYAMGLPASYKLANLERPEELDENTPGKKAQSGFLRTADGKRLLRDMMARYVPNEVIERKKQGFSAPDGSWFRGESIDFVRSVVESDESRIYRYLDRKSIRGLIKEHTEGSANRRLLIWSVLHVEEWLRQFDRPTAEIAAPN